LGRNKFPVTVEVGAAIPPTGTVAELDTAMRDAMTRILHRVQQDYPHPEGQYWVPRRLGGGAPTLEQARTLDEAELAERARKRSGH
jgi:hypothetical protein